MTAKALEALLPMGGVLAWCCWRVWRRVRQYGNENWRK